MWDVIAEDMILLFRQYSVNDEMLPWKLKQYR